VRVLVAIALGALVGALAPDAGRALKPVGDTFINLVRMVIAPVIFLTVVLGIASMRDLRQVGRVGGKAFPLLRARHDRRAGHRARRRQRDAAGRGARGERAPPRRRRGAGGGRRGGDAVRARGEAFSVVDFLLHAVPTSVVGAFAEGDVLQVVVFSVLFGVALTAVGPVGQAAGRGARAARRGVLQARGDDHGRRAARRLRRDGLHHRRLRARDAAAAGAPHGRRLPDDGAVRLRRARPRLPLWGFRLLEFLRFIREEILLVLGTSSSEAALPRMLEKLERYGCARSVVGLVVPAGYSFNLDGTSIYLSMATIFLAQAYGVDLSLGQQLSLLAVLMVTSKGAAGVTGSGFVVLASTLAAVKVVPVEGLALLLGVDRFMSEARAITNLIGNGVATLVVSRSEGAFDDARRAEAVAAMRGRAA
jgi:aerobic C4-dicarboxylate transport protein